MAIQDEGQGRMYQNFADNLSVEPDMEEPSAEEIAERAFDCGKTSSDQPGTPASMAM